MPSKNAKSSVKPGNSALKTVVSSPRAGYIRGTGNKSDEIFGSKMLLESLGRGKISAFKNKLPMNSDAVEHPFDFRKLEAAYLCVPIISGGIDKTVDFVMGAGFSFKSEDKEAEKAAEEWRKSSDAHNTLRIACRNSLVYGIGPAEVLSQGEETKLNILDPKSFYVTIDDSGDITGYKQILDGKEVASWRPDEIAYFSSNTIGHEPYGTSLIRPLYGTREGGILPHFIEMQQAMNTMIKRKANAPLHVKIGSDDQPANQTDIDDFASDLSLLRNENEFVTNHLVEMDVVGFKNQIMDFRPFVEHYENNIVYGLQVPVVLLGLGNVNEGLAKIQNAAFERHAKAIQDYLEKVIEQSILPRVVGKDVHVEVEWNSSTEETLDQKILRLMNILKVPGLSDDSRKDIEMLIRKELGLPEKEIKLNPITQPGQKFGGDSQKANTKDGEKREEDPKKKTPPKE